MSTTSVHNVQVNAEWHAAETVDDLSAALKAVFTVVSRENEWRTDKDEYHWGLYEGTGLGGVKLSSRRNMTYEGATLPDNVCKMAVDTLTAKVATIRPLPQVLASRGNWKDLRRARKMRQFIEGEFYRQLVHEKLAARIIKDSLVCRAGVVQVFVDGKKPKCERVHSWTLFVDDWDAESGEPLSMFRLRTMDRGKAMAKWGKKNKDLRDKIKTSGRLSSTTSRNRDEERSSTVDRIELLEAWYRCPNHDPDDKDHECTGRHVIISEGAVLFDEEWPHDFFPFAVLSYDTPNTGYWGTPLVQTLEGYQVSANESNSKLDEMYALSGKYVILRDGGGIFDHDVQNGLHVLHCKPGPYEPIVFDADLVNEHMRARPAELVERGLNASGVSQMSAQAQKPTGIDAGIALQTLDDIESQRHIVFGRRFESWCMDVARLLLECVKKIAKEDGEYAVKVPMRGAYLDVKWKDVEVDGFQLQMQSVGQLYMSFAGRLDKLKMLFEMGAIDRGTFMRNLDAGDVQGELDLETSDRLLVDEILEAMLDTEHAVHANDNDDYLAPNGYMPLEWAHKRAHQKRLQAQVDGAPLHVLELLGRFIDDVAYLLDKKAADAAAKAAASMPPAPLPPPTGGMPMPSAPGGAGPMPSPDVAASSPLAA